jgi:hypothetical protein
VLLEIAPPNSNRIPDGTIDFMCGQLWSPILGLQAVHHLFDRHADALPAPPQEVD